MRTLWGLLFWAITLFLVTNSLLLMKEQHPGYATGLAVLLGLAFCAFTFGDFKK
jgi:hypothetical protein